eukprot:comp17070_c0_seq1/m.15814 comp17070_c0_seq1/g.15814  ORF comp17070_c0_seq1/g.15814 comp17070_c0_seq1/m.15814 type:complete len:349 (-) comp17070_c0_seq1:260-1306(-)
MMSKKPKYQPLSTGRPTTPPPPPAHPPSRKVNATGGRFVALPSNQVEDFRPQTEQPQKGRVTVYCTAGAYDKKALRDYLEKKQKRLSGPPPKLYQDVLYVEYVDMQDIHTGEGGDELMKEIFYFDYGVLVMWGMTVKQEQETVRELEPFEISKLDGEDVDIDEFDFVVDKNVQPRMMDDVITINNSQDYRLRLAISYALSQSTKLSVFEEMIDRTIDKHKTVPVMLAKTGAVKMSRTAIAKVIGQLFMQTSAVNLVSNVLDTPDFFWEEPDYLERLYKAIRSYLEITKRCDVLNKRLTVVQEMMNILKDEQHQLHGEKLEWIVIWLIVIEIIIGLVGIISSFVLHFQK